MPVLLNYIDLLAAYFVGTEAYCTGDPTIYSDIVFVSTPISQSDLDGQQLYDYKVQQITAFSVSAKTEIINGFESNALGSPHGYDSAAEDQLNLIGAVASSSTMNYSTRPETQGTQLVDIGGTTIGTDLTGFLNNATMYNAEVKIDGISEYLSVAGQDAQTIDQLIALLNIDFGVNATVLLSGGNILITSSSYGSTSTVNIIDANLFNQITGYVSVQSTVAGVDWTSVVMKEYKTHTNAQLLQVLNDGKDVKLNILQKFNVKKAQVLAAVDTTAVDAIVW